jgi:hypothetical protein
MKILLIVLILLAVAWLLYRTLYVKRKTKKKASEKLQTFASLLHRLSANEVVREQEIMSLAGNPSTRHALYGILKEFNRTDIFPDSYFTLEKSAESFLVNWLEFPTELNAAPDEIKFFTAVTLEELGETFDYLVFKYRKAPPPKGISSEWMLGVTGPFGPDSKPYDVPLRVYSRFNELGTVSALEEARWVHQHISRK